jgi:hypothetical protein
MVKDFRIFVPIFNQRPVNKTTRHKIVAAWLLLVVFTSPFVVKAVHACHSGEIVAGESHARHDCTDCPICHFVFSLFVGAEVSGEMVVVLAGTVEPVTCQEKGYARVHATYLLRAPPVA